MELFCSKSKSHAVLSTASAFKMVASLHDKCLMAHSKGSKAFVTFVSFSICSSDKSKLRSMEISAILTSFLTSKNLWNAQQMIWPSKSFLDVKKGICTSKTFLDVKFFWTSRRFGFILRFGKQFGFWSSFQIFKM